MLSFEHPAIIHSTGWNQDIVEILVDDDFCKPLKETAWEEKTIFTQAVAEKFAQLEEIETDLLLDLFRSGISEVAFRKGVITVRLKEDYDWKDVLLKIDSILEVHHISIRYDRGDR